jgi:peptide/nickel transport system permease protein
MIPNVAPAPADSAEPTAAAVLPSAPRQSAAKKFSGSKLFASPASIAGVAWLAALVVASLTAPLWLPFKTEDQDFTAVLSGPTAAHWLGTDELGRDLLSRIFASAAGTLGTSMITVIVAVGLGTLLAMLAAAAGERVETVISRATEIVMSLPGTVIILAVIGAVGTNIPMIMGILGVLISAGIYRVMLGQAKSLQSQLYVDAAKVDGVSTAGISLRHVLPGLTNTIVVQAALIFAVGMLIQAGLAFIGFGPPIPQPSWGGMIQGASQHVYDAPWLMVPTGAVLALTVLAANAIGNALGKAPNATASHLPSAAARRQRAKAVAASLRPLRLPRTQPGRTRSVSATSPWCGRRQGGPPGHGRLLRRRTRHRPGPGGRVRLRQDHDGPVPPGPAALRSVRDRRPDPLERQEPGCGHRQGHGRHPRTRDRPHLAGTHAGPGPHVHRGLPAHGHHPAAPREGAGPTRSPRPLACWKRWASWTPRAS